MTREPLEPRALAAHLVPEITEGRIARQWAALESKRPTGASHSPPLWRVASLATVACCLFGFLVWKPAPAPSSGAVLESSDSPTAMQLRDGTSVELAAQTRLRVLVDQPDAVEIELAQGNAHFDVTHVDRRSFTVRAGVVAVRVVGTKFEVIKVARPEGVEIAVSVQRGIVAVERTDRGDVRRLTAGEKWSAWVPAEPADPHKPPAAAAEQAPIAAAKPGLVTDRAAATDATDEAPQTITLAETETAAVSAPGKRSLARRMRSRATTKPAQTPLEPAHVLFAHASVARRAGLMQEAADDYADLLAHYPRDARAAVSAFELGRIRMDALDDARGAAQAFSDALRLSRKAQFREDALARLAIAQDALGDRGACRNTRERYLSEFAAGVHAVSLAALCGDAGR